MFKPVVHYSQYNSGIEKAVIHLDGTRQLELTVSDVAATVDESGAETAPASKALQFNLIDTDELSLEPQVKLLDLTAEDIKPFITLLSQLNKSL